MVERRKKECYRKGLESPLYPTFSTLVTIFFFLPLFFMIPSILKDRFETCLVCGKLFTKEGIGAHHNSHFVKRTQQTLFLTKKRENVELLN